MRRSLLFFLCVGLLLLAGAARLGSSSALPAHARGGSVYRDEQASLLQHYQSVWERVQERAFLSSHAHTPLPPGRLSQQDRNAHVLSVHARDRVGPNTTANTFEQRVDHQDPARGTFAQRWWVDTSMARPCPAQRAASPTPCTPRAMLFIHGESPASSSPTGYALEYGAATGSYLFALEHRFYGESLPGPLTDRRALDTLNVANVLADLQFFKAAVEQQFFGNNTQVMWYVVGGSYSGALSVWLRQAYPDEFAAAWSSSGVVNAIFDFSQFDAHVRQVLSRECGDALHDVLHAVADIYRTNDPRREQIDTLVDRPVYFSDIDVQWMLTDGTAMAVQYGRKELLCERLLAVQTDDSAMTKLSALVEAMTQLWGPAFRQSCYYSGECLSNASYAALWAGGNYAWVYQCCTELAFWQTSYPSSLRTDSIDTSYFMHQCRAAFGRETFPNTFDFNARYGGAFPWVDRVIATHGSDDPWLPAGVQASLGEDVAVVIAHCSGCGHCGDLHAPQAEQDPAPLTEQRQQVAAHLNRWLNCTDGL